MICQKLKATLVIGVLVFSTIGCERPGSSSGAPQPELSNSEKQQVIEGLLEATKEDPNAEPAEPSINLATPAGWTKGELRPLPEGDRGFSVAYEHESGLAVTLYQFTRGHKKIPSDTKSKLIIDEMEGAKTAIEQAVKFGIWKAAVEINHNTVQLGDSEQQALWSQYHLKVDDSTLASDIYVWAHSNTFFKLRCTARSEDATSNQEILAPLLTALGSPMAETE